MIYQVEELIKMNHVNILTAFIKDLQDAEKLDRESVMIQLIENRLDKCLDTYITTLNKDIRYLKARNQLKMIRKLTK